GRFGWDGTALNMTARLGALPAKQLRVSQQMIAPGLSDQRPAFGERALDEGERTQRVGGGQMRYRRDERILLTPQLGEALRLLADHNHTLGLLGEPMQFFQHVA